MHASALQQQQLISDPFSPAILSSSPALEQLSAVPFREHMTKHPRDGAGAGLTLSLGVAGLPGRANKQPRRAAGEFVCKTCSRAFASFQALGGHRTSHLRGRHGLALGLTVTATTAPTKQAAAATIKEERPAAAAAASHRCNLCGAEFEMGQALGGHMRRHNREEHAATAQAPPPVLLQLFV